MWAKTLYTNKSIVEVEVYKVSNWNHISKVFLYEEAKIDKPS